MYIYIYIYVYNKHKHIREAKAFMCPLSANVYKIDFVAFKIRAVVRDFKDEDFFFTQTIL